RNDEHVVGDVRDAGLGGPARWDGGGFAQAYQADHVVEGGAEHRVVGVAVAGDELVQFGQGGCGADGYDLDARHHDLLGGVVGEVQGALQNVGLTAGQVTVCLGLVDDVAQLLQGGAVVQFFDRFDAHAAQEPVGRGVEQLDDRPGDGQVDEGGAGQGTGEWFGLGQGEVLGGQLTEHHLDDRRQGEAHRQGDGADHAFGHAEPSQRGGDQLG